MSNEEIRFLDVGHQQYQRDLWEGKIVEDLHVQKENGVIIYEWRVKL
jgi:activator of HSP90 ATPase